MAEQFLTLMADLDGDSQVIMAGWYEALKEAGFVGTQTAGLPYHISLATFPLDKEREAVELMRKAAAEFAPIPVHIRHIGLFAGGKVLFGAPEMSPELAALHDTCESEENRGQVWTPHVTLFIDEPSAVCDAIPVLVKSFYPFTAKISRLHLCAFWPTREIAAVELCGGTSNFDHLKNSCESV